MGTNSPLVSEHPWMEHNVTGHRAQLPDIDYWRANGWTPCDGPPPEPDLTQDPPVPAATSGLSHVKARKADSSTKDGEN